MLNYSANGPSGYNLTNSLRFRSSASAYLNRTPASAGNQNTWTWSGWIKRGALGSAQDILSTSLTGTSNSLLAALYFDSSDRLTFFQYTSSTVYTNLITTQVFRDPSAWYHIVIAYDDTQATASNRVKIYVNGSQITAFGTASYPTQNFTGFINQALPHAIGRDNGSPNANYLDGYLTEINFVNAQALTPSSFGNTNAITGVWQPARYTGTYGTNGYYLNFTNIALTSGSNTGLGQDFSGNGNFWNTNNISVTAGATYDAMSDVPTLTSATQANYCTGNPLDVSVRGSFANANLTCTTLGGGSLNGGTARLNTFNFTQLPVRWYWESTVTNAGGGRATFGMETTAFTAQSENWSGTAGWFLRADGVTNLTGATTFAAGDVMMFAYDGNTARFWIGKNGTWTNSGVPASGTNPNRTLTVGTEYWLLFNCNTGGAATAVCEMNFGQRPFAYTPPSGFVSVNTFNLPTSTIVKGNTVMDATLYTGNGATRSITNDGSFRPDFVWIKARSIAYFHRLADSVRGTGKELYSNDTGAETTNQADGYVSAFNSNGFSILGGAGVNLNANTFVAWQWQAGQGSTSTNTAGSITSTVSVNTSAGFSVVTYTSQASGTATFGHGLGVAPSMIFLKGRNVAGGWYVYHSALGGTKYLALQSTGAVTTASDGWNNTNPTSTVVSVGNGYAGSYNMVAYCWAEIAGFSAFGSYTGNNSADGSFVYLGFRPKFIMFKKSSGAQDWFIFDTSRNPINVMGNQLSPNLANAESSGNTEVDYLSNGFKIRYSGTSGINQSGTYIYAAFAENPFKNALAR